MTSRHHSFIRRHTLILGIVLGTASLLAQAQAGSSTAPVPGGQASQGMHQGHHEGGKYAAHSGFMHDRVHDRIHDRKQERMQARQAKHLQELKDKLQLAPTQDAAWAGFTGVLQARHSHTPPVDADQDIARLNTPERLERMKALRAQHQTEMNAFIDRRADATKALYAALTPDQQKIFDAQTARMMQARGHGHGHGMHSAGGRG